MARLESRSELARIAGVSPAAITKACKGPLAAACDGRRVDLDHPAVRAYLAATGRSAGAPTANRKSAPTPPSAPTASTDTEEQPEESEPTDRPRLGRPDHDDDPDERGESIYIHL